MNYKEYFNKLESDPEYIKAKEKLGPIFDVADEVLRLRLEKGWSQAELADRAGTKQANISRLESGLSNPSLNFLQKLAKAFGTNMSLKFGESSSVIDSTTNVKYETEPIPLPYKGFGIKTQNDAQSSSEITSASIRRIYA